MKISSPFLSFRNLPLKYKLIFITLLVSLVISWESITGLQHVINNSNKLIYEQTANSMGYLSKEIANALDTAESISLSISVNQTLQKNIYILNNSSYLNIRSAAQKEILKVIYTNFNADVIATSVLPEASDRIVWGQNSSPESPEILAAAKKLAREKNGSPGWLSSGRKDGSILCVRQINRIKALSLEPLGIVMIRVNLNRIVRETARRVMGTPSYTINIHDGNVLLYPSELVESIAVFPPPLENETNTYSIQKFADNRYFVTRIPIVTSSVNWSLTLGVPYNDLFYSVKEAKTTYIIRIITALILTVFLSGLLFREITVQFNYLLEKMRRVRSGNLEPYPFPKKNQQDELGQLNQYFDQMTADFKKVIDDNYVKELLLTQTQLKSLEQQINPHFLYNSLDTIHWFANRSGEKNISVIVQALGNLLRSSLSDKQDLIPLEEEIKVLENYLLIQKIRFPDTLSVSLEIPEETLLFLIPKMSIQPLVENAVIYGLDENIDGCHIIIRAELRQDFLHVEVENNGSEINEDILELLKGQKVAAKRNGVGLTNIDSRIKLLFDASYGLQFKNGKNSVTVFFDIPARTE